MFVYLKKSQYSDTDETSNDSPLHSNADQVVKSLLKTRLVYRILRQPIGNINVSATQMYSVRGFFLSINGKQYRFLTQAPLLQHWSIDDQVTNNTQINNFIILHYNLFQSQNLVSIVPPLKLNNVEFNKTYKNKLDVVEKNDLSAVPPIDAPCLTISVQDQGNKSDNI